MREVSQPPRLTVRWVGGRGGGASTLTANLTVMCSETDFTQEEGNFLDEHLQEPAPPDDHLQEAGPTG